MRASIRSFKILFHPFSFCCSYFFPHLFASRVFLCFLPLSFGAVFSDRVSHSQAMNKRTRAREREFSSAIGWQFNQNKFTYSKKLEGSVHNQMSIQNHNSPSVGQIHELNKMRNYSRAVQWKSCPKGMWCSLKRKREEKGRTRNDEIK